MPDYWPTTGWRTSVPEWQGMHSGQLWELHEMIRDQNLPLDSVVIVRNGYIVYEDYPNPLYDVDSLHILHSVTKSFTSALIGIAIDQGYISSVLDTVVSFFPDRTIANLTAWKQAMTVEHMLNMMAGIEWDEWTLPYGHPENDLMQMVRSGDCVQFMLDRPMAAEPGTVWVYNTGASHLLAAILYETTGQLPLSYAIDNLLGPLGIDMVFWTPDSQGLNYGGSELHLTPRDMAKFGFLYLQEGHWDGVQIIPAAWVNESRKSPASLWYGVGYGYQWWKELELGTFEARGYQGQWIIVHPEHELVVIFTATDVVGRISVQDLLLNWIFPAISETPLIDPFMWIYALIAVLLIGVPIVVVTLYLRRRRSSQVR